MYILTLITLILVVPILIIITCSLSNQQFNKMNKKELLQGLFQELKKEFLKYCQVVKNIT